MSTILDPLRRAVAVAAPDLATICGDVELTYGSTWQRCRRLLGALRALGIGEGDRVAIVGPNCHRYLEVYQTVPGAGMVLVPLNSRHTEAELRYALEDSGARVLFAGRDIGALDEVVEHVIDLDVGYEQLCSDAEEHDFPSGLPEDGVAGLFYTGGTTGAAKGVMLTHRNLIANAWHFQGCWPFGADTCWLIAAPLFHAAGSVAVLATIWHAGRHVVLPAFDPAAALELIERHGVNATLMVPTMVAALSEEQLARPRDVSTLRFLSHGGSPIATETLRRAHAAFPDVELMHLYGATETAPIATAMPNEELLLDAPQARSCGQPVAGVEISILNADGTPAPPGVVGEVAIKGDNVMVGYWNKPGQTADVLVDGWYRSGDLGYVDDRAYLYLVDRAKDMIVTGGENVYSTEVEEVLFRHPAVLEAAVFGIPDERWGEAVHAVIVTRAPVTEEELLAHCRTAIAGYKVPKRLELRDEPLPKSGAGKVLKRELRAPFWADREALISGT